MRYVVKTDTHGERRYLRLSRIGFGGGYRYGLVKRVEDATELYPAHRAGAIATRAGQIISRYFEVMPFEQPKRSRVKEKILELVD